MKWFVISNTIFGYYEGVYILLFCVVTLDWSWNHTLEIKSVGGNITISVKTKGQGADNFIFLDGLYLSIIPKAKKATTVVGSAVGF